MSTTTIKAGKRVTWPTHNRWGKGKKTGKVIGFVPRNASAVRALTFAQRKAFKGPDKNTINDRYLVKLEDGRITAPRAPTVERALK